MKTHIKNYKLTLQDIITSDKIFNYVENLKNDKIKYIKTDFIKHRKKGNFLIEQKNWRNKNEIIDLCKIEVLITGHSDHSIKKSELDILELPNLKIWFCENKNFTHEKLKSIPIGITNRDEPNSRVHQITGNLDVLLEVSKAPSKYINLCYLNFNPNTYPKEREVIINKYNNKSFITVNECKKNVNSHKNFLENIKNHSFTLAPRGNGIDTHRLWESLYLGSIPIVKKTKGMEDFYDLPILFVDNWDNLSEEFLKNKLNEFQKKKYDLSKMKLNYWLQLIKNYVN